MERIGLDWIRLVLGFDCFAVDLARAGLVRAVRELGWVGVDIVELVMLDRIG